MAELDPEARGGTVRRMEQERARGVARLAGRLAEQGALRPDVPVDDATEVLRLLTSFDAFDLLFTGRGLAGAEVTRRLTGTAERGLYRSTGPWSGIRPSE